MRIAKILLLNFLIVFVIVFSVACSSNQESNVKTSPIVIEIWTYYSSAQRTVFDAMLEKFNQSVGKEKGIIIKQQTFGDPYELDTALLSAVKEDAGALAVPDAFITYRGIDNDVKEYKGLINFYDYYSVEELAEYVDAFIEMGVVHENDGDKLNMFPIVRSQSILMMNDTDFNKVRTEIGIDYSDLETYNKLIAAAKKYYEYTDAQTEQANDGKALYTIDSATNYFFLAAKATGGDFLVRENGKTVAKLSKKNARLIWNNYYVPMVKGYFAKNAKYGTEDIKIGELLMTLGSTAGTLYFPEQKFVDDIAYDIDMKVMNTPYMDGKEKLFYVIGGGFFAFKNTPEKEEAVIEFLKWFTSIDNNAEFAITSGYMPVMKKAFNQEFIDAYIKEHNLSEASAKTLIGAYKQFSSMVPYAQVPLSGFEDIRSVVYEEFADFTKQDAKMVRERVAQGEDYDAVLSEYLSDSYFDNWYESFMYKVNVVLEESE